MHIIHSGIRFTLLAICFYIRMKDVLHTQQRQFVEVNKVDCENGENGNCPMSSIEGLPRRITQDGQRMYKRNLEARSRNHGCHWKAINITYSECVFVALVSGMQSAYAILYCYLWPVRLYHIFADYLVSGHDFRENIY
jgi:hypothetical protein